LVQTVQRGDLSYGAEMRCTTVSWVFREKEEAVNCYRIEHAQAQAANEYPGVEVDVSMGEVGI